MFKIITAAGLACAQEQFYFDEIDSKATEASKVCIENRAGFVMNYKFSNLNSGVESRKTANYPILQMKCLDIADSVSDIEEGDILEARVKALGGVEKPADPPIRFRLNSGTLIYRCTGATLTYGCHMRQDIPKPTASNVIEFIEGFFEGAAAAEGFEDLEKCIKDAEKLP